jgi:hypothetical protein
MHADLRTAQREAEKVSKKQGDFLRRMAEYFSFIDTPEENEERSDAKPAAGSKKAGSAARQEEFDRDAAGQGFSGTSEDSAAGGAMNDEVTRILETAEEEIGRRKGKKPKKAKKSKKKKDRAEQGQPQFQQPPGGRPEEQPAQGAYRQQFYQDGQAQPDFQQAPPQPEPGDWAWQQVNQTSQAPPAGEAWQEQQAGAAGNPMAAYIFETAGIRSGKDLKALMRRALGFDQAVSLILFVALGILILLQPGLPASIAAAVADEFGRPTEASIFSSVLAAFAVVLLVWSVVRAYRFGAALQRRRLFLRLISRAEARGLVSREEVRAYAANRFGLNRRLF